MKMLRALVAVGVVVCLVILLQEKVLSQESPVAGQSAGINVTVSSADKDAAETTSDYRVHLRLVKTEGMAKYSPLSNATGNLGAVQKPSNEAGTNEGGNTEPSDSLIPEVPAPGFYPADVSHLGGPVVLTAESHDLFVDCAASCWGNPSVFQNNLYKSSFIHVADQYVGLTANGRYTVGTSGVVSYPILTTLSDNDILQIVHSAAGVLGTGYHHIYHVFLPKGVDECFVGTTQCYSPDNPSTFVFCAYHSSVTFSDIGHVLFTVQPYQDVPGCGMLQPSPNGGLIDSTSSVLGHETFETITDPDPPTGWLAVTSNGVFGEEIGDLCPGVSLTEPFFENPVSVINGKKYEVQPMYSNKYHACSFAP